MTKIPENLPPKRHHAEETGDPRELLSASKLTDKSIAPKSLSKANAHNGVNRLHGIQGKKDPYQDYFSKVRVVEEPHGGKTHLTALRTMRTKVNKGGYVGIKPAHKTH